MVEWEVVTRSRRNRPRCAMALGRGGLPHDLEQLVVEASLGVAHGFWGCVADGATFRSMGQRARTRAGRAVIAAHRRDLATVEHLVHQHLSLAEQGRSTPAAEPLAQFRDLWAGLGDAEPLTVEWPTLRILQPA